MLRQCLWSVAFLAVAASVVVISAPRVVEARGGSSARITGVIHDIDYDAGTLAVGLSYYGSGVFVVYDQTKVTINGVNATFDDLADGDIAEVNYVISGGRRLATKIQATAIP